MHLISEVIASLDSTDLDVYRQYFMMSTPRHDIPARCAYFLGERVAQLVALNHTLPEMVSLSWPATAGGSVGQPATGASVCGAGVSASQPRGSFAHSLIPRV